VYPIGFTRTCFAMIADKGRRPVKRRLGEGRSDLTKLICTKDLAQTGSRKPPGKPYFACDGLRDLGLKVEMRGKNQRNG